MSTPLAQGPPTSPTTAGTAGTAGTPRRWRRHRSSLLIVAGLLAALALAILTQGGVTRAVALDPDNPGPDGARALARVLDDQGVAVDVVRSADALDTTSLDPETLVVVTSSDDLGESTTRRLLARTTAGRAALVVVDPTALLLDLLGVDGERTRLEDSSEIPGGCTDLTYAELTISVDTAASQPVPGCFDDVLAGAPDGGQIGGQIGGQGLTLLGAGGLMSNDQVTRGDNAAIALRLLGSRERLVWYVASDSDQVAGDGVGITSLLPAQVLPGLAIVLLSALLLVLWRGRRLGPLATEPLPVVVKAIETTRSRGRLYRVSGDRAHAATALRAATRARAVVHLRLGSTNDEAVIVRDVARHVGRAEPEIAALIAREATAPGSDRDLIDLANDLAALEEEVRRT